MLPVRRKVESAIEGLVPPVGRINRLVRAGKRGDADLQLLSEGLGIRLNRVRRRKE